MRYRRYTHGSTLVAVLTLCIALGWSAVHASSIDSALDMKNERICASGVGFPAEGQKRSPLAKQQARAAAKAVAMGNLLEMIDTVVTTATTLVQDSALVKSVILTRVEGRIHGARTEKVHWRDDGSCEVTVCMPLYGKGGFMDAFYGPEVIDEDTAAYETVGKASPASDTSPEPSVESNRTTVNQQAVDKPQASTGSEQAAGVSGIVIDARHTELTIVGWPKVLDHSRHMVFDGSPSSTNLRIVVDSGAADWYSNPQQAQSSQRVAPNPYQVVADSVDMDAPVGASVFIDVDMVRERIGQESLEKLMRECRLIFLIEER
ncbi:hypothetical protein GF377_01885 [candidate division GN15 bacterium]|nr:hypothetical protein [candidate division GN15 bacterium]